jgi:alkylation response protein AidB-like acyl-CoA dehydrogenase
MKLSPELERFREELRRFAEKEIEPRSRWIEENDAIPDDLMAKARELGLFGITIPEEYGGVGLDLAGKCMDEEELGRSNYGFATVIANHTGISTHPIVTLGSGFGASASRAWRPANGSGLSLTEPQPVRSGGDARDGGEEGRPLHPERRRSSSPTPASRTFSR